MAAPIRDPDYVHAVFAFYRYAPSLAAAVLFCILFFIATLVHGVQIWRSKTWFMLVFLAGGLFEVIGYIGRAKSAEQQPGYWTLFPYILQSFFLLVAPALFAASIYMILGRIIQLTDGDKHSLIPNRWITKFFILGDVFAFVLQGSGGGVMAGGAHNFQLVGIGQNIIIAGLVAQAVWFAFFIAIAGLFHFRLARAPTSMSQIPDVRWQGYLGTLYIVSSLIMIRSIIRVIEYIEGNNGFILRNEVFLYIFDAIPMLAVMLWMVWKHPSEISLLLRGEPAATNGFQLLQLRRTVGGQFTALKHTTLPHNGEA